MRYPEPYQCLRTSLMKECLLRRAYPWRRVTVKRIGSFTGDKAERCRKRELLELRSRQK
jgi:hypothetical protein